LALRRARAGDLARLAALVASPAVAPFVAYDAAQKVGRALDREGEELLVVEVCGGTVAGGLRLVEVNRRSRIWSIETLMLDPAHRGTGLAAAALRTLARERFASRRAHRLQAEIMAFNVAALHAFTAAGFRREGVRRRAYDRHGTWQDGILVGLIAEDPIPPG